MRGSRRLRTWLFSVVCGGVAHSGAAYGGVAWGAPSADSYQIEARLDPKTHSIEGVGTIVWTNRSLAPVDELYWHLYLNAFQDAQSYFLRSPFEHGRTGATLTSPGGVEIHELKWLDSVPIDLLPALEAHSPNDPQDTTDLRLPLPRAVAPNEQITLSIRWTSTLPNLIERTGYSDDFYFAGQWFPKLARLEPDGRWAHFRFHRFAEFYADFANYEVTLDVPEAYVVGASGQRLKTATAEDRKQVEFLAEGVHDFAWSAWPHFETQTAHVGATEVELLYPPGHDHNATRTLETLAQALPRFAKNYGPYPHPKLTVVHPPRHATPAAGMEYPGLITTGGSWYSSHLTRSVETVTIHELAHQSFQGALANDEQRWPFLDEGLGSYAESLESEAQFGAGSAVSLLGFELSTVAGQRALMLAEAHDAPLGGAARSFSSFGQIGATIYARSTLLMRTLGNVYGKERLQAALSDYTRAFAGRHPTLEDFLAALAPLGDQATANLRGALEHGHGVDYELRDLRSARNREGSVVSRVWVHRHGQLQFPVEIQLETLDGEHHLAQWDGQGRSHAVEWSGSSPVVRAWVDPNAQILLDENLLNNSVSTDSEFPLNLFERGLYALQLALSWLSP